MKQRKRTRTADSSDNESLDSTSGERGDKLASAPPMINDIDWRGVICKFLDKPTKTENDDLWVALQDVRTRYLEMKDCATEGLKSDGAMEPNYITIHRINCNEGESDGELSLGVPWPVRNADGYTHLRGREIISNLELHLERNKWVAFIVYKDYSCCTIHEDDSLKFQPNEKEEDTVS
ncbi:hypothetical protein CMQ_8110 [Grosmannia clavigera kw1407]|uniref:Uncharacterized protein n=1 Tax=Grosmannia clavigera (strain kw1407 / UAMH 11150) TaxID=655863 RepID=F0XKV9_GROCL|nr:uncharacterized protein CMQ_8110 [Grosmannia clavigera kw1407]EFX01644.1 hypothetical protein CMQ_8110 [Grosmannia clavigera kw1407]